MTRAQIGMQINRLLLEILVGSTFMCVELDITYASTLMVKSNHANVVDSIWKSFGAGIKAISILAMDRSQ
jgi:hypothetical protein